MADTEVESITNGLDRCSNLLKDLLNEPYSGGELKTAVPKAKKALRVGDKPPVKVSRVLAKKTWNYGAKKPPPKGKVSNACKTGKSGKTRVQGQTTSFNENLPSSTPMVTPIKKEKLKAKSDAVSITSSQCSLIELLQEYNTSTLGPNRNVCNGQLESTLKNDAPQPTTTTAYEAPTLKATLNRLYQAVEPFNAASGGAIQQCFAEVLNSVESANTSRNNSQTLPPPDQDKLVLLQSENITLHKQLRSLKQDFRKTEREKHAEEINLQVATLQCQNAALEKKLKEMISSSENSTKVQNDVQHMNIKLQEENEILHKELGLKNEELAMSGKLFTSETEQIKLDVGDALEKVELLRQSLTESDATNVTLTDNLRSKDLEIQRLTDMNKSLQSTVSRLLGDLQHPNPPPHPQQPPQMVGSEGHNMSSLLLKQLDSILSVPFHKAPPKSHHNSPRFPMDIPVSLPRSPIPYSGSHPRTQITSPSSSVVELSEGFAPLISSCSSSSRKSSASSSMLSVNTRVENEFSAGLATLDADIRRLQDSLLRPPVK